MNLLINIINCIDNHYILKFNTNDEILYLLTILEDNITLMLTIHNNIFFTDINYYKYENSINFIINNNIATYYKIESDKSCDETFGEYTYVYFKNINPEILLQLT